MNTGHAVGEVFALAEPVQNAQQIGADEHHVTVSILSQEAIARTALASLLETQPRFEVISELASAAEVNVTVAGWTSATILIVDLSEQEHGPGGLVKVQQLRKDYPQLRMILLSHNHHQWLLVEALGLGVQGYLYKTASAEALFEAIRIVNTGGTYLDPTMHSALASEVSDDQPPRERLRHDLSNREREVLKLLALGQTNAQIGKALHLSPSTIKYHLNSVYRKLGVCNRAAAARLAVEVGIVFPFVPA